MTGRHKIPAHVNNSTLERLIDERVRREEDREILRDKWFRGRSFYNISAERHYSLRTVKDIVYKRGDPILLEAARIDAEKAGA